MWTSGPLSILQIIVDGVSLEIAYNEFFCLKRNCRKDVKGMYMKDKEYSSTWQIYPSILNPLKDFMQILNFLPLFF